MNCTACDYIFNFTDKGIWMLLASERQIKCPKCKTIHYMNYENWIDDGCEDYRLFLSTINN